MQICGNIATDFEFVEQILEKEKNYEVKRAQNDSEIIPGGKFYLWRVNVKFCVRTKAKLSYLEKYEGLFELKDINISQKSNFVFYLIIDNSHNTLHLWLNTATFKNNILK